MSEVRSLFSRNVIILTISNVIWMLTVVLAEPYFYLYTLSQGGTVATIGLIGSIAFFAGIPLYPVGGYISDHKGRVKLIGIMTYFYAATNLIFAFADSWVMLAIGKFLQNSVLFYYPSLFAIQIESLPRKVRGTGFAIIAALPRACGIVAPFIGGYVIHVYGLVPAMRILYTITFFVGIFVASLRLFGLEETVTQSEQSVSIRNLPLLFKEAYKSFWDTLKSMSRPLTYFTIVIFMMTFFAGAAEPYYLIYFTEVIGFTPYEWGQLSFIGSLIGTVIAIPIGRFIDRYGGRKTALLSVTLAIPSFVYIFCNSYTNLLLFISYFTIMNTFMVGAFRILMADLIPSDKKGQMLSALGSRPMSIRMRGLMALGGGVITFASGMLSIPLGAYLYGVNNMIPFLFLSGGLIFCFLLIFKFIHDPDKKSF